MTLVAHVSVSVLLGSKHYLVRRAEETMHIILASGRVSFVPVSFFQRICLSPQCEHRMFWGRGAHGASRLAQAREPV